MAGRLEGKSIVITGAAGGIGSSAARLFAAEGARLTLGDLDGAALASVATELRAAGHAPTVHTGDLTREEAARGLMKAALSAYGRLDGLFNVAGISGRRFGDGPVDACTVEGWEKVLSVNLKGAFLCCKYAIPAMREAGGGSIVNLSSVLGLGGHELFSTHAYAASKGGLVALTRSMAATYAREGIRCNVICPALVRTPMSARAQDDETILEALPDLQPLTGDFLAPEDVANAALFLASDESAAITGVVLPVDAGWRLR